MSFAIPANCLYKFERFILQSDQIGSGAADGAQTMANPRQHFPRLATAGRVP
jgi:hypothetical protein